MTASARPIFKSFDFQTQPRPDISKKLALFVGFIALVTLLPLTALANAPAFSVHKNGTDQTITGSTNTLLTWSTEVFDTNNNFASNRFTPTVAGKYLIVVSARCAQPGMCIPSIYKNGALYAQTQWTNHNFADQAPQATAIIDMNGTTDHVEAFIFSTGTVIGGTSDRTYFSGSKVDGGSGGGTPAGTVAGAVQFRGSTAVFAADDINLVWDDTNKRLGIGTATPTALLDLSKTQAADTALKVLNSNGTASARALLRVGYSDTASLDIFRIGNAADIYLNANQGSGKIRFQDAGVDTLTISETGNVGIGTTTPTRALTVQSGITGPEILLDGGANARGSSIQFNQIGNVVGVIGVSAEVEADTSSDFALWGSAGSGLRFYTNGSATERMVIDTAGNVGIRTATPSTALDVNGLITGGFGTANTGGTLDWNDATNARSGSGHSLLRAVDATNGPPADTSAYFHPFSFEYVHKNGTGNLTQFAIPYGLPASLNEGMFVRGRYLGTWTNWYRFIVQQPSGNVGIGTSAPQFSLDVLGSVASRAASSQLRIIETDGADPNDAWHFSMNSGPLGLIYADASGGPAYTNALHLANNGNVGIGTTAPTAKLTIANNLSDTTIDSYGEYQILLHDTGSATTGYGLATRTNTLVFKTGSTFAFHGAAGTSIATINASGLYAASDQALKRDIEHLDYGLSAVMRLKPASYHLKEDPDGPRHIGFIAQDVKQVVPEVVIGDEGRMQLAYPSLVPVLTKAIQELKAANDNLKADNDNQSAAIDELRREIEALKAAR